MKNGWQKGGEMKMPNSKLKIANCKMQIDFTERHHGNTKKEDTMKNWKKAVLALVAALVVLSVGQVAQASDSTDTISITVSVTHVGVAITSATFDFATLAVGATAQVHGLTVTNTGSATETYGLRASGGAGFAWTLASGPGVDFVSLHVAFVSQGGFASTANIGPNLDMTQTGDTVTTSNRFCTNDGIFSGFEAGVIGGDDGFGVPTAGIRAMSLHLMTPTAVTSNQGQQTIYLTAVAGP